MAKTKNFSFGSTPSIRYSRSKMAMSYGTCTTTSVGRLIPFYQQEVIPGDSFSGKSEIVARLTSSLVAPIFGNLFIDTFYFFVPYRLCMSNFADVFGNNDTSAWAPSTVTTVPVSSSQSPSRPYVVAPCSVANYLEYPVCDYSSGSGVRHPETNPLSMRAFALIYNEWFRDENLVDPVLVYTDGTYHREEYPNADSWSPSNYAGMCPNVAKMHDYFTSALPQPQKGSAVDVLSDSFLPLDVTLNATDFAHMTTSAIPTLTSPHAIPASTTDMFYSIMGYPRTSSSTYSLQLTIPSLYGKVGDLTTSGNGTGYVVSGASRSTDGTDVSDVAVNGSNLGVYQTPISVNDLRLQFQAQKMLEKDAMYGTRYCEYLLGHFGVSSPDARLQRPEFLGGKRIPIRIQQVASTNRGSDNDQLGSLGAYSLSSGKCGYSKGFTEHGIVIGVCAIRQFHSYQQGFPRSVLRSKRLDFYDPVFANIGNQPILNAEIYNQFTTDVLPTSVFGYQEAWADYRYHPNVISGQATTGIDNSLDIWHMGDYYTSLPVLGKEFIEETPVYLDRSLSVSSDVQDQFILDIWHDFTAARVMPVRSTPGLIDHH